VSRQWRILANATKGLQRLGVESESPFVHRKERGYSGKSAIFSEIGSPPASRYLLDPLLVDTLIMLETWHTGLSSPRRPSGGGGNEGHPPSS
jgi:hypothetical protein